MDKVAFYKMEIEKIAKEKKKILTYRDLLSDYEADKLDNDVKSHRMIGASVVSAPFILKTPERLRNLPPEFKLGGIAGTASGLAIRGAIGSWAGGKLSPAVKRKKELVRAADLKNLSNFDYDDTK